MEKLYLVFDQLPSKKDGGLIATYINMTDLLKEQFEIHVVTIFDCTEEIKKEKAFSDSVFFHSLTDVIIDNRFYRLFEYLLKFEFTNFFHAVFSMLFYFLFAPIARNRIKEIINKGDLVIVSSPAAAMFMSKSIPFILEIHIYYDYFFGNNILGRMQSMLMRTPVLTIFRSADDAKRASKKFESTYIYNFYKKTEEKLHYNRNDHLSIIFMGRLSEQKHPERLIECADLLKEHCCDFTLDIYGDGNLKEKVKKMIAEKNLQNNVNLCGFTSDKNIYENYDILWMTSRFEGLPMVIVEAKSCGIPTISVNWGNAVYEVIQNNKDGFVVDTNDQLVEKTLELWSNREEWNQFSNKCKENYYSIFSPDVYKSRLLEIFEYFKRIIE